MLSDPIAHQVFNDVQCNVCPIDGRSFISSQGLVVGSALQVVSKTSWCDSTTLADLSCVAALAEKLRLVTHKNMATELGPTGLACSTPFHKHNIGVELHQVGAATPCV